MCNVPPMQLYSKLKPILMSSQLAKKVRKCNRHLFKTLVQSVRRRLRPEDTAHSLQNSFQPDPNTIPRQMIEHQAEL